MLNFVRTTKKEVFLIDYEFVAKWFLKKIKKTLRTLYGFKTAKQTVIW